MELEMKALMQSMGVSSTIDEFFSSTTKFVSVMDGKRETDKEVYFRQEIWQWMENSLSKGSYKWVVRTINPTYDIHSLYTKIVSLANKATWISHALEFRKIFTIPSTSDIFQYHADLIQQMKVVRSQRKFGIASKCSGLDGAVIAPDSGVAEPEVPEDRIGFHDERSRGADRSPGQRVAETAASHLSPQPVRGKERAWSTRSRRRNNRSRRV
jgi:hypothetical protein